MGVLKYLKYLMVWKYLKELIVIFGRKVKLAECQSEWREQNRHNNTQPGCSFPISKVHVGTYTYGTLNVISYENESERLDIGNYCSIAGETKFLLSGEHDYRRISTFPFSRAILQRAPESICKGPIIVEDGVWIGYGCIILSGVRIGTGAVIGAGSVVRKDVPPFAIFAGGRIIGYRFNENITEKLQKFSFPMMSKEEIAKIIDILESHVSDENVDEFVMELQGVKHDSDEGIASNDYGK